MFPNQLTFYFNYRISGDTSGGLQLFGLISLIYGPIIFALTMVLLRLYTIEFKDFLERQDNS
ncbi:TPA: hypothetical protein RP341_004230 [Acinetobacter baumannii]|nr:hypothetical protein [Acinetobacter baumannii]HCR0039517.1 hypothetical protein [Acinetobacter baumannii]HDX5838352.1 hypothetical protein [Acinetobacter baumannii]HDX5838533.1 hypothetical protein [Acinetobacter baumannii]